MDLPPLIPCRRVLEQRLPSVVVPPLPERRPGGRPALLDLAQDGPEPSGEAPAKILNRNVYLRVRGPADGCGAGDRLVRREPAGLLSAGRDTVGEPYGFWFIFVNDTIV